MAIFRIQTANAIIFQLIRKNLQATDEQGSQWQEVTVCALAVNPAVLRYQYGSRVAISQTTPDEGFVDRYGQQLPKVFLSGTFGIQPRRQGLLMVDGISRLLNFRDYIFKLSQSAYGAKQVDPNAPDPTPASGQQGVGDYVYAVNYYDFIYDERFLVNLDQFIPEVNAARSPIEPVYQLSFTGLGPVIPVTTSDPLLKSLFAIQDVIDGATQGLDDLTDTISNIAVGNTTLGKLGNQANLVVTLAGQLIQSNTNIKTLASLYKNGISNQVAGIPPAKVTMSNLTGIHG